MGKLLNSYLQTFGPSLQSIAQGGEARQPQAPGGHGPATQGPAQTFPMGDRPAPGVNPQLTKRPMSFREMSMSPDQRPAFASDEPPPHARSVSAQPAPQSTFQPPAQIDESQLTEFRERRPDLRKKDPSEIKTFDELWASADEKEREAGAELLAQQLGGEEGMDKAYTQLTGNPPDTRLTKADKAQLLMEFGLRTLALSDQMSGLGAAGQAGTEAMGRARQMKQEKREAPMKARRDELETQLLEAQVAKAKQEPTEIHQDADGNLVIINKQDGSTTPVRNAQGDPITSGSEGQEFAAQVDRKAYESLYCGGLEGDALKRCKQRALAYSKGGAATIAFPELSREKIATNIWNDLRSENNERRYHVVPSTGESKRWRDLSGQERIEIADQFIDETLRSIRGESSSSGAARVAPTGWESAGLTEDQARQIPSGNKARLPSWPEGRYVANIGGRLVEVDESGRPIDQED